MASTQLHKTFSGAGNRKTFTLSFWVKRTKLSTGMYVFNVGNQEANPQAGLEFQGNDTLTFWNDSGSGSKIMTTTQVFTDANAWYHLVFSIDTTQSTASDRVKIYVNGEQITSFSTATYPDQNYDYEWNGTQRHTIGAYYNNQSYFDGLLSHIHFVDGTAYPASTFGSTDSVTGEWSINTSPSITMGTNGFTILKDGNTITDQSANSNNFTLAGGTLTNTEDCPSNVFATFNNLIPQTGATFNKGNTACYRTTSGTYKRIGCTIGATSGKYYAEFLLGASQWGGICLTNGGDIERTTLGNNGYMGEYAADKSVGIRHDGIVYSSGANVSSAQWNQGSLGTTDKLCLALDMDNKKLFLGKNGTWNVSSNPATNTGGISLTGDSYTFCGATSNADCKINTGNGYFGTDAISSEGTNASGIGKFEYDVPTGFTALSTKGLNE